MDADPSLSPSRRRQDQMSNVGSSWEGTDCGAAPSTNRADWPDWQGSFLRRWSAAVTASSACLSSPSQMFPRASKSRLHDDEPHDDLEEEKSRTGFCSQAEFYTVHSKPTLFTLNLNYDSRHWEQGLPGFEASPMSYPPWRGSLMFSK